MSLDRRSAPPVVAGAPFGPGLALRLLREERERVLDGWGRATVDVDDERACRRTETWLDVEAAVLLPWLDEFADLDLGRRRRRLARRHARLAAEVDRCRARAVDAQVDLRVRGTARRARARVGRATDRQTATVLDLVDQTLDHTPPACEQVLLRSLVDRLARARAIELVLA